MPNPKTAGLTPEQHAARDKGIGSSDAAAAVGLSPWKTPVQLWLEKTGRVEPTDISGLDHIIFGNLLEDIVAQEYARRENVKVQQWRKPYVRDHMIANVDRLIVGTDMILECKTVNAFAKWESVPDHYRLQVEHQLICANKQDAALAVLIGGNQFDSFPIHRHTAMSEMLIAKEAEFWSFVERDIAPEPLRVEDVIALYPVDSGLVKIASAELREVHAELMSVRDSKKSVEEIEKALKEKIQLFLGEDTTLVDDGGAVLATWKRDRGTQVVNYRDAFHELAEMKEVDADTFLANHTYKRHARRFLPKKLKDIK